MDSAMLHDLTPAYALDALDEHERAEYEAHLDGCRRCQDELAELRDATAALAYAAPAPAPPAALRERLLEGVAAEEAAKVVPIRRRWPVPVLGGVAVGAAAAAIGLGIWAGSLSSSLDDERAASRDQVAALEVLGSTDAQRVPLTGAEGQSVVGADGTLIVTDEGAAALVFATIDAAPDGQTYEAWLIRDGVAIPAGLFSGGDGVVLRLAGDVTPGTIVAVTIEQAGGVGTPTSDPILSAART